MLFAAATHLVKRLSLDTLLTLKVEMSLICLVGTRRPAVSIIIIIIIIIIIQFFIYLFTC
jgi:hypothetical protein